MSRFPRQPFPAFTAVFLLVACLAALASALYAQYGLGMRPCVLCVAERVPFAVAALFAALALGTARMVSTRRVLLWLAAVAMGVNALIAVYHVGVEQFWWQSAVCSSSEPTVGSTSETLDLAAAMSRPVEDAPCDQPAWAFHGVTMASLNVAFSGLLALLLVLSLRRRR
ncbi:disulfide bond formation protein B [Magnetospirillum molischianum]|uniref:Disulfide bond formation protein DsbB n=1 Tax=Magnetospirillum molischianum DSM 120 TaxID=1150626 RepID=H8FU30_MAGML|nr:disulfide bond formation protein B [Magnetospirillum molischianum]CCG41868.1 Disulfide bond formation protein DsbB [Magnetospirillum molischianum DSM 120]